MRIALPTVVLIGQFTVSVPNARPPYATWEYSPRAG
jgi:hypothetical protein